MSGNPNAVVRDELTDYLKLKALLEAEESDPQAILDTLEGETNLHEALLLIADSALDDETMAEAVGLRIKALQERRSRAEVTAEHKRALIIMTMERAGLKTIKGVGATLSIRDVAPKVVVEDESAIPSSFFVPQEPKLDKKALTETLREGRKVPGATLSNGGVSLTIRVK